MNDSGLERKILEGHVLRNSITAMMARPNWMAAAHLSALAHPRSVSLKRGDVIANGLDTRGDRHRQHQADRSPKPAPEHHGEGHGERAQLDAAPDQLGSKEVHGQKVDHHNRDRHDDARLWP